MTSFPGSRSGRSLNATQRNVAFAFPPTHSALSINLLTVLHLIVWLYIIILSVQDDVMEIVRNLEPRVVDLYIALGFNIWILQP